MPTAPVVVVDALDECPQATAVQTLLLMPLSTTRRADGGLAGHTELRRDLRRYLISVLGELPFAKRLASGVARKLVEEQRRHADDPAASRWGQFLVADRYAQHLLRHPPSAGAEVEALVDGVPVALPQVLELELAAYLHATCRHPAGACPVMEPIWATGGQLNPALRTVLTGHDGGVYAVACATLNGRLVAVTGGDDRTVRVWDLGDRRCDDVWPMWAPVTAMAASVDGRHLVVAAGWDFAVFALDQAGR